MGECSTKTSLKMMNYYLVLVLLSSVYADTEKIKATVKVGKTKFTCTFTLASDGGNVTMNESKVVCTPNKPTKKKVQDYEIFNFCPYDGSPGAEADAWDCPCLQTRMLELDI